jgi:hypothetical protein
LIDEDEYETFNCSTGQFAWWDTYENLHEFKQCSSALFSNGHQQSTW